MMSEHLSLELAAASRRRRPLEPGEPVPGCTCEACTGIAADHPARLPAWRRRDPDGAARTDRERQKRWAARVASARSLGIVEVATRLGCGESKRRGRELVVRCPLHGDEEPSCTMDPSAGLWYCFPCGQGGDAIQLYMLARRLSFFEAVRELVR